MSEEAKIEANAVPKDVEKAEEYKSQANEFFKSKYTTNKPYNYDSYY